MNTSVTYGIFRQKLMITYKLNTFISRKKIIKMRSMACLALHRGGNEFIYRGVAGGGGGPESPRNMADQLTLFEPGWADFAPHNTASPLGFKKLSTPLQHYSLLNFYLFHKN